MTPPPASPHDTGAQPREREADPRQSAGDPMASHGRRPRRLPDDPSKSFSAQAAASESAGPSTNTLTRWALARADAEGRAAGDGAPRPSIAPLAGEGDQPAYVLERVVGRGGYGEVWQAVQSSLARSVAVKRLREDIYDRTATDSHIDAKDLEHAFRQEALTTGSLEHPNIVPVHDFGLDDEGRPLLAMKLVKGEPWHKLLEADAKLTLALQLGRHLPILSDVAQAVAFAHSRGVVHRDIKPSQVMVGEFGEVLLMDWGLATVYDEDLARRQAPQLALSGLAPLLASASSPSGTPAFMAPEQTEDNTARIGPWTDVYLLAGTLYFLLTGTPPHDAPDAVGAFQQAMEDEVPAPEERAPDRPIPRELAALCMRGLSRDPRDRPASVAEFLDDIRDYQSGASRQRESEALTARVVETLGREHTSYEELADCDNLLARALGLWPGNPQAVPVRDQVLAEYARLAVQNSDLVLARVQATRIDDPEMAVALIGEIDRAEAAEAGRAAQRRHLQVAVGLLGVGLVAGSVIAYGLWQRGEADRRVKEMTVEQSDLILRSTQNINEANELLKDEAELAERLAGVIPMPTTILPREDEARFVETERAREALAELEEIRARRRALRDAIEERTLLNRIGEAPMELLLVEPNIRLRTAQSREELLEARDLYRLVHQLYPEHPLPLRGMGIAAARAGELAEAGESLRRSTNRARLRGGEDNAEYLRSLQLEVEAVRDLAGGRSDFFGEFAVARAIMEPRWAEMTLALSEQARALGDSRQALEYARLARAALAERLGAANPRTLDAREAEASALVEKGRLDEAMEAAREVLLLRIEALGAGHLAVARSHHAVACILHSMGHPIEAVESHREALRRPGRDALRAQHLHAYAGSLSLLGRHADAREALAEALAIRESVLGVDHPFSASTRGALALVDAELGDRDSADQLSVRAAYAVANAVGAGHPMAARTELARGRILALRGDPHAAQARIDAALAAVVSSQPSPSPVLLAELRIARGALQLQRGNPREALADADRVLGSFSDLGVRADLLAAQAKLLSAQALVALERPAEAGDLLAAAAPVFAERLDPAHALSLEAAALAAHLPEGDARSALLRAGHDAARRFAEPWDPPRLRGLLALEAATAEAFGLSSARARAIEELLAAPRPAVPAPELRRMLDAAAPPFDLGLLAPPSPDGGGTR